MFKYTGQGPSDVSPRFAVVLAVLRLVSLQELPVIETAELWNVLPGSCSKSAWSPGLPTRNDLTEYRVLCGVISLCLEDTADVRADDEVNRFLHSKMWVSWFQISAVVLLGCGADGRSIGSLYQGQLLVKCNFPRCGRYFSIGIGHGMQPSQPWSLGDTK